MVRRELLCLNYSHTYQTPVEGKKRKRGRPSNVEIRARSEKASQVDEHVPRKKRGRPSKEEISSHPSGEGRVDTTIPHKKRGPRGPPPGGKIATRPEDKSRESERLPRKRQDRLPRVEIATDAHPTDKPQSKPSPQRENHPSPITMTDPKSRRPGEIDIDSPKSRIETTYYQCIAPVVRGVSRHIIDSKWAPLPSNAIERIVVLLNEVERSVVMRLRDDHKRTQAGAAIKMVSRRLHRKLSRGQPFPPSTRPQPEEDFDFEKILDSSGALEAKLTPILHSIGLLKAVAKREEAMLDAEVMALDELKGNAKVHESQRYNTTRKLHAMSRSVENFINLDNFTNGKGQQKAIEVSAPAFRHVIFLILPCLGY